jgi:hypothetical protein
MRSEPELCAAGQAGKYPRQLKGLRVESRPWHPLPHLGIGDAQAAHERFSVHLWQVSDIGGRVAHAEINDARNPGCVSVEQ